MRVLRNLIVTILVIVGIIFGIYHFGTNFIADKVVDQFDTQLHNSEDIAVVKQFVNENPTLKQFVSEGSTIDDSSLPFNTKEEAVKKLVTKFSITEMKEIQSNIQSGMTDEQQQEIIRKIETKLTSEELEALKVIAYKELNK
ncbi:hypothetical protein [Aquibacillus rhizosphaerae]|uniref:Phenylalanyl-tRNA synthetase subunit beta n=1 Tax=Aquibacillus rhizosphaerae TaxID=3051431 RepID=A0ABT7L5I8_9BACI|nr:hypothetical protein [Aquibacillus sp. LR5S19]MDL4841123.1 hypothetical protein [Aquibacillus sp. LR5S19]